MKNDDFDDGFDTGLIVSEATDGATNERQPIEVRIVFFALLLCFLIYAATR